MLSDTGSCGHCDLHCSFASCCATRHACAYLASCLALQPTRSPDSQWSRGLLSLVEWRCLHACCFAMIAWESTLGLNSTRNQFTDLFRYSFPSGLSCACPRPLRLCSFLSPIPWRLDLLLALCDLLRLVSQRPPRFSCFSSALLR